MSTNIKDHISSTKKGYRPEIDGLRAFAVLAVIINHFNKGVLPGGYLGVDIFFVISGFVITSSIYRRPINNFKDFISGFYERRIKRLVPALSVFVLITAIVICLFNPRPIFSIRTGLASLFGVSNIYLFKQSTDYFAQNTELNVFTHTWSLGVEEQFYFIFPFLVWFSGFGKQTKNGARNLFFIVGALTIISLIRFIYLYPINQSAAYFLIPTRFWEMSVGCLCFIFFQKRVSIAKIIGKTPPLLLVVLIVGVMYLPKSMAVISTILIVALSGILITALKKETRAYKIFTNPKVVSIGLISYSLYLWHWGVLSVSRWTIGVHWWSIPFQSAIILILSIISYRFVEKPFRENNLNNKRLRMFLSGGSTIILISTVLIFIEQSVHRKLYTGNYQFEKLVTRSRNHVKDETAYNGKNCHYDNKGFQISTSLKNCFVKTKNRSKTFFFAGNSHTDHHRSLHYALHKEKKVSIFSATISDCLFLGDNCINNSQEIIADWILKNIKPGDVVIVSNKHNINSDKNLTNSSYNWLSDKESIKAINTFNALVKSKGAKLVLFAPIPEYDISIEQCTPNWFRPILKNNCNKTAGQVKKENAKAYFLIKEFLEKTIPVYNPIDDICFRDICSMTDTEKKPLYVDDDHLSDYANTEYIFPGFLSFLIKQEIL